MRNLVHVVGRRNPISSTCCLFPLQQLRAIPSVPSSKGSVGSLPIGCILMISTDASGSSTSVDDPVSARVSPDQGEPKDEVFSQVLAAILKSPRLAEKVCTFYADRIRGSGNPHVGVGIEACNRVLVAAGEGREVEVLCRVFKHLVVSVEPSPSACYLSFARGFDGVNDSAPLLRLVEDVWEELGFPSGIIVVNRIIFAFGETRQVDKALAIFRWMKDVDPGPDLVTYNIVLEILGRAGQVNEMFLEFDSMKDAGIVPDFISYNTLLNQLRKAGRLDLCLVYYREMVQSRIQPDLLTFTALIESLGRAGNVEEALRLFNEMKDMKIRPSIYIYRSLIKSMKKMGKIELALTMLDEMNTSMSNLAGPKDFKRKGWS